MNIIDIIKYLKELPAKELNILYKHYKIPKRNLHQLAAKFKQQRAQMPSSDQELREAIQNQFDHPEPEWDEDLLNNQDYSGKNLTGLALLNEGEVVHPVYLSEFQTELNSVNFTNTNLTGAQFKGVYFVQCVFDSAVFNKTTIEYCIFEECSFKGTKLDGAYIYKCLFVNCDINVDISGYDNVINNNLHSNRENNLATFESDLIDPADIPGQSITDKYVSILQGHLEEIEAEEDEEPVGDDVVEFTNLIQSGELRERTIKNKNLQHLQLTGAEVTNVTFKNCNMSTAELTVLKVVNSKFLQIDFTASLLEQSEYVNCLFYNCNFTKMAINGNIFINCTFNNNITDRDTDISNNTFNNCVVKSLNIKKETNTVITKNWYTKCTDKKDAVSQEYWYELLKSGELSDPVLIEFPTQGKLSSRVECGERDNFFKIIEQSTRFCIWVPNYPSVASRYLNGKPIVDSAGHGSIPLPNSPEFIRLTPYHYVLVHDGKRNLDILNDEGWKYKAVLINKDPVSFGNVQGSFGVSEVHGNQQTLVYRLETIE